MAVLPGTRRRCKALALVALMAAPSCASEESEPAAPSLPVVVEELEARDFVLEHSQGFMPLAGTTVRLQFLNRTLTVYAGCNHQGGGVEIQGRRLRIVGYETTRADCGERRAQDGWLQTFVLAEPDISRSGERITLRANGASLTFLPREIAEPDQPLVGAPWKLSHYTWMGLALNISALQGATIAFAADGTLSIVSPCSTHMGNYAVVGTHLRLSNLAHTEMRCAHQTAADMVLQNLFSAGDLPFALDRNRLTFTREIMGVTGSRPTGAPDEFAPAQLAGPEFALERAEGFALNPDSELRLSFDNENLSFSAGCNTSSGEYYVRDGTLIIGGMHSTLAGCLRPGAHEQDSWLVRFFTSRPRIALGEGRVTFSAKEAMLVFRVRPAP